MDLFSEFSFDEDYLTRLRGRHDPTCRHFYNFFYLRIRSQLRNKLSGKDVTDLVQDVFVAALRGIDNGQPKDPSKLPGYMSGICRNLVHHAWISKNKLAVVDADLNSFSSIQISIETLLMRKFSTARIHRVLSRMLQRDREVILQVVLNEEDRKSVAQRMCLKPDDLKVILCRALKRFRREWDKETASLDDAELNTKRELTFHD